MSRAIRDYRTWVSDGSRWSSYRPRNDDVIVATYPKSGTTWTQQIVTSLIFQTSEALPVTRLAPWLDRRTGPLDHILETLERQTHRHQIKSHIPFDGMPYHGNVKYVYVARDGRDACLSYHHHCRGYTPENLQRLDAIGASDPKLGGPIPRAPEDAAVFFRTWISEGVAGEPDGSPGLSWFGFEKSFWAARHLPNVLLVHYRDLKADLDGEMRRIARFLSIETPEALWPALVKAATFEEMKKVGDVIHPGLTGQFVGAASHFFARGENDRWSGVLDADDLALFDRKCAEAFEPDCNAWLRRGRLAFKDPRECR